jgi:hypothetical protein
MLGTVRRRALLQDVGGGQERQYRAFLQSLRLRLGQIPQLPCCWQLSTEPNRRARVRDAPSARSRPAVHPVAVADHLAGHDVVVPVHLATTASCHWERGDAVSELLLAPALGLMDLREGVEGRPVRLRIDLDPPARGRRNPSVVVRAGPQLILGSRLNRLMVTSRTWPTENGSSGLRGGTASFAAADQTGAWTLCRRALAEHHRLLFVEPAL